MNLRNFVAIVLIVGALTCTVRADEIKVGALSYRNITVVGAADNNIIFIFRGKKIEKSLAHVTKIHLTSNPLFNTAETLRLQSNFQEAAKLYKRAILRGRKDRKSLIEARLRLAESYQSATKTGPSGPKLGKCVHCKATGLKPCIDCKATGRAPCADCIGKRHIACPTCSGNWSRKCPECKGEKKIQIGTVIEAGIFKRPVYEPCKRCDRTGIVCTIKFESGWISRAGPCPTCGKNRLAMKGKMPCPKCHGIGRKGPCPRCKGTRKVICTYCSKVSKTDPNKAPAKAPSVKVIDPKTAWQFKPGKAAAAKSKYDVRMRAAKAQYDRIVKELETKLNISLKQMRNELIRELNSAMKEAAAIGDLDEAVKIRDAKIAAEKGQEIPTPPPAPPPK